MTRPTPLEVRYGADHDVQLRDALFEAWDRKCHVCRRPKQFHEIQIDHLIPQAIEEAKKQELIVVHELPADFDLNRPANLAPACAAPCNGEKSNQLLSEGLLDLRLKRAAQLAPQVIATVRNYATSNSVSRNLRVLRTADLTDPAVRAAFERDAPAIVQQLALLDERKADYVASRTVDLGFPGVTVDLALNARGRAAICVIEEVCECTLSNALELAIDDLVSRIGADATGFLEAAGDDHRERLRPAGQERDWLRVTTDTVDFHRTGVDLTVTLDGRVEGLFTAEMTGSVLSDIYGHPTGEVDIAGRFLLTLTWNLSAPGAPGARTSVLTDVRGVTVIW